MLAKVSREERNRNLLNNRTAQVIFRQESIASKQASTILQRMTVERQGVPICNRSPITADPKPVRLPRPAPHPFGTKAERRSKAQAEQEAAKIRKQEQADLASIRKVAAEARKAEAKRAKKRAAKARRKLKKAPLEPGRSASVPKIDSYRARYNAYINSHAWQDKRRQAFAFHGRVCNHCRTHHNLHVHHITYANFMHEPMEDLMILCESCHEREHERLELEKTAVYAQKSH